MTDAGNPVTRYRPERRSPGTCRVCGCTNAEGCIDRYQSIAGAYSRCRWVEVDLCSRCHGPRRPTRRQRLELARLNALKGTTTARRGPTPGTLLVALQAYGRPREDVLGRNGVRRGTIREVPPPTFLMGPTGRLRSPL